MAKKDASNLFAGLAQQRLKKEQRSEPTTVEPPVFPVAPIDEVTSSESEQPPEDTQQRSPQKGGRAKGKRSNSDYTQVGAYIPKELKKQVDRLLFDEDDTDFSDLVATLLQEWVSSKSVK